MLVYRIVKSLYRTADLSGRGAAIEGGRWNREGLPALYTSESRALAMLEVLVHFDNAELPTEMYVMTIEVDGMAKIKDLTNEGLPADWREVDHWYCKKLGSEILSNNEWFGFKVKSAVMPMEHNVILNPNHPSYSDLIKVLDVALLGTDQRLHGG